LTVTTRARKAETTIAIFFNSSSMKSKIISSIVFLNRVSWHHLDRLWMFRSDVRSEWKKEVLYFQISQVKKRRFRLEKHWALRTFFDQNLKSVHSEKGF
jgi:hypothetical protein